MTKVLLDNGIMTRRSLLEGFKKPLIGRDGGESPSLIVIKRVQPYKEPEKEAEAEAIATVGRLYHTNKIEAFNSMELAWEGFRDFFGMRFFDSFENCTFKLALNPIERALFFKTDLGSYIQKGGKKDLAEGKSTNGSQIQFLKWLKNLDDAAVTKIIEQSTRRGLTDFDIEGFKDLRWFKEASSLLNSDEHLPDVFYLWTVRRNQLDVFLTLDFKLVRMVKAISERKSGFKLGVRVETPLQFLKAEGIEADPYPFELGREYLMGDVERLSSIYKSTCF